MKFLSVEINSNYNEEEAIFELEKLGYHFLYSSSEIEKKSIVLHVTFQEDYTALNLPFILNIQESMYEGVDWEEQWELNCKGFQDNKVTIKLSDYLPLNEEKEIFLQSGPGFGDLSHPTTRMMIKMISQKCFGKPFIDIGCGSGILSFVARAFGATKVYGYDIEKDAILHSQKNKALNENSENIIFDEFTEISKQLSPLSSPLIGLNMIEIEQNQAWEEIKNFLPTHFEIISSGIKKEQRDNYLNRISLRRWNLIEELSEEGWLCFHFKLNKNHP